MLERFAGESTYRHHGERVVAGQRLMQAAADILLLGWITIGFLGWTTIGLAPVSRCPGCRLARRPGRAVLASGPAVVPPWLPISVGPIPGGFSPVMSGEWSFKTEVMNRNSSNSEGGFPS